MVTTTYEMDFPADPTIGQQYENALGVIYEWSGEAWVVGFYDSAGQGFTVLGDIISQIRVLLQDTDDFNGGFRYSTDSLVANLNQGMLEMFRLRPDIFLETDFVVPVLDVATLDQSFPLEQQWIPPLVYYTVGLTQLRDDELNQDQRANAFMSRFTASLMTVQA